MDEEKEYGEFTISGVLGLLLPKWPIILAATLLVALGTFLYARFLITPVYTTYGTLYITGDVNAVSGTVRQNTNLNDLMLSQELAKTYGQILSSNTFFKNVAQESNLGYDYQIIQRMTSISNVEDTGVLAITVNNTNPQVAQQLANTILELAPAEIERIVAGGNAEIIDPAELPLVPDYPNIPKYTLMGALAGFLLSVLGIFLLDLFDHTIKTGEEITTGMGLPVLGMIPHMEEEGALALPYGAPNP